MRKSLIFLLLVSASLFANAWATDEANGKYIAVSLKQAGDTVGSGMEAAGKAIAPEVSKAEAWLDGAVKNGDKKTDKAGK